jgi:putative nucleotidyltransferase with HDIG domain
MTEATLTRALRVQRRLRPRRAQSALTPAAWLYWAAVVAPAALVLERALRSDPSDGWTRFAVLAGAASIAQLSSVHLTRNRVFHPAIVFVVAGALVLSPEQLVLMCVVQHIPDWLKQRYAWYIQPFNIANYVLAALGATTVVRGVDAIAPAGGPRDATAGLAVAIVFVLVNRLLLVPMLRSARGVTLRASRLFAIDDVTLEIVLALMAVPLALLWQRSLWVVGFSLAPLALIHFTQRAAHRLELASETIGEQNEKLEAANQLVIERSTAALEALSATVDARDAYTAGHSRRVREFSLALGGELGISDDEMELLSQAALLHDIGKIGVPDSVLLKEGPLTQAEWIVMKSHPEEGARIIERLGYLDQVVPAIRHHHERLDGRGYPHGLHGDEIPLAARIIHVADALDAMLTRRVYREAMSLDVAVTEIHRGRGTDFCPRCVDALDRALADGLADRLEPAANGTVA